MLYARRFGNPSYPKLVCLHGFLGSSVDFEPLIAHLSQFYHCICVDLPGFGLSPFKANLSLDTFPEIFDDFLKQEQLSSFDLLCYSLGGRLGLHLKKQFPHVCKAVTLIGAHTGLSSEEEKTLRRKKELRWSSTLKKEGLHNFLSQWYRQPLFKSLCSTTEKLNNMIQLRSKQDPLAVDHYLTKLGLSNMEDMTDVIYKHLNDFTFIAGSKDNLFKNLYQQFEKAGASSYYIDETTHAPHLEKPNEVAKLILKKKAHGS